MSPNRIPVLMYHALEDDQHQAGAKELGEQLYVVSVSNFREQMCYLHSHGYKSFLFNELSALDVWPEKSIVITFDDGHESNYTLALPLLQKYGFTAEYFITTGWLETRHYLTQNQVSELHQAGMSIGSHSVSHPYFDDLTADKVLEELKMSRDTLGKIIGKDIHGFSAPGGRLGQLTLEMAPKRGYKFLCTSDPKEYRKDSSMLGIPRFAVRGNTSIDQFIDIVTLNPLLLQKIRIRAALLNCAKKILGNRLYEKAREKFL